MTLEHHSTPASSSPASSFARRRFFASLRALAIVALLTAATVRSPLGVGLITVSLLPLPFAFVALRYGWRAIVPGTLSLAVGAFVAGWQVGGVRTGLVYALLAAGLGGVAGGVVAACGMGRRFQRFPLTAVTVVFLAVTACLLGAAALHVGSGGVVGATVAQTRTLYDNVLRDSRCVPTPASASRRRSCAQVRDLLDRDIAFLQRHRWDVVVPTLALLALACAATALWAARFLGSRFGLPIHRPAAGGSFAVHWSVAYLLAAGLASVMTGSLLAGGAAQGARAIGIALAAIGGVAVAAQGVAVVRWGLRMRGVTPRGRVFLAALVVGLLIALPTAIVVTIPALFFVGLSEMLLNLRRRNTMHPPDAPSDGQPPSRTG